MEAIDTVMSKEQCQQAIDNYEYRHLSRLEAQLHAQAEISFPKGEKQGRKEVVKDFETVLDAPMRYRWAMFFDVLNGWQEQLKE